MLGSLWNCIWIFISNRWCFIIKHYQKKSTNVSSTAVIRKMLFLGFFQLLFIFWFSGILKTASSQNINFVLVVEGRRYGLASQFTTAFQEVENLNIIMFAIRKIQQNQMKQNFYLRNIFIKILSELTFIGLL